MHIGQATVMLNSSACGKPPKLIVGVRKGQTPKLIRHLNNSSRQITTKAKFGDKTTPPKTPTNIFNMSGNIKHFSTCYREGSDDRDLWFGNMSKPIVTLRCGKDRCMTLDLEDYKSMMTVARNYVNELKGSGNSLEECIEETNKCMNLQNAILDSEHVAFHDIAENEPFLHMMAAILLDGFVPDETHYMKWNKAVSKVVAMRYRVSEEEANQMPARNVHECLMSLVILL